MWFVLSMILLIAFLLTITYLYLLKRDLHIQTKKLQQLQQESTNQLLHQEFPDSTTKALIHEINQTLVYTRAMKVSLQQQQQQLQQEITNISHDLKTPLTSAIGYIDLLRQSNLDNQSPEEIREELTLVTQRLFRLNQLVTDFFEFSKVRTQTTEFTSINVLPLLEESLIHVFDDFSIQNRAINLQFEGDSIPIFGNEAMIRRIFENLCINALKHGIGDLEITIDEQPTTFVLTFSNTYTGKSMDEHAIFDAFYTSDISRTKGGSGLGLAIVKEFVLRMKGTVTAQTANHQLEIVVTLPKKR